MYTIIAGVLHFVKSFLKIYQKKEDTSKCEVSSFLIVIARCFGLNIVVWIILLY